MEASLCGTLTAARAPHLHGTPESFSFEVSIGPRRRSLYVPSIILTTLHSAERQIVVEPIDSAKPGGGARRLVGFRQAHLADYFVVVVARRVLHYQLPEAAYDLLVPLEDFQSLQDFLSGLR